MVFLDCPPDVFISAHSENFFATDIGWPNSSSSHSSIITANCFNEIITPSDRRTTSHPFSIERAPFGNHERPTFGRHMGQSVSKIEFKTGSFFSYIL